MIYISTRANLGISLSFLVRHHKNWNNTLNGSKLLKSKSESFFKATYPEQQEKQLEENNNEWRSLTQILVDRYIDTYSHWIHCIGSASKYLYCSIR